MKPPAEELIEAMGPDLETGKYSRKKELTKQVSFRVPDKLFTFLERAADTREVPLSKWARQVLEYAAHQQMLAELSDPEVQARLGKGAKQFEQELRIETQEYFEAAFGPYAPSPLETWMSKRKQVLS